MSTGTGVAASQPFNIDSGLHLQSLLIPKTDSSLQVSIHLINPSVSSLFKQLIVVEFGQRKSCQRSMLNIYRDGDNLVLGYGDNAKYASHSDIELALMKAIESEKLPIKLDRDNIVSGVIDGNDLGGNDVLISVVLSNKLLTGIPERDRVIFTRYGEELKNIAAVTDSYVKPSGGKTYFDAAEGDSVRLLKFMGELYRDKPHADFSLVEGEKILRRSIQPYTETGDIYYSPSTHQRYLTVGQMSGMMNLIADRDAFIGRLTAYKKLLDPTALSISNGKKEMMFLLIDKDTLELMDADKQAALLSDFEAKYELTVQIKPDEWSKNIPEIARDWDEFLSYFSYSTHPDFRADDFTNPVYIKTLSHIIAGEAENIKLRRMVEGYSTPLEAENLGYILRPANGGRQIVFTTGDRVLTAYAEDAIKRAGPEIDWFPGFTPKGPLTREIRLPQNRINFGAPPDLSKIIETGSLNPNIATQLRVYRQDPHGSQYWEKAKFKKNPPGLEKDREFIRQTPSSKLVDYVHAVRICQYDFNNQLLSRIDPSLHVEPFSRLKLKVDGRRRDALTRSWIAGKRFDLVPTTTLNNEQGSAYIIHIARVEPVNYYAMRAVFSEHELLEVKNTGDLVAKILPIGVHDAFSNALNVNSLEEYDKKAAYLYAATNSALIAGNIYGYYGIPEQREQKISLLVQLAEENFITGAEEIRRSGPLDQKIIKDAYTGLDITSHDIPEMFLIHKKVPLTDEALAANPSKIAGLISAYTYQLMPLYNSVLQDIEPHKKEAGTPIDHERAYKLDMSFKLASEISALVKTHYAEDETLKKIFTFLDGFTVDFSGLNLELRQSLIFSANIIWSLKADKDFPIQDFLTFARHTQSDSEFAGGLNEKFPYLDIDFDVAQKFHKLYNTAITSAEFFYDVAHNPIDTALEFILR
jgi:hypothetical protein